MMLTLTARPFLPVTWFFSIFLVIPGFFYPLPVYPAACGTAGIPHDPGSQLESGNHYMGIRMQGSLRLENITCKSLPLMGLSGLAWSDDTGILYALSDRGNLFHLQPVFREGQLINVRIIDAYPLRGSDDRPLGIGNGDSEGLAIVNGKNGIRDDETLLISFERQPRISRYRPYGLLLKNEPLHDTLAEVGNYADPNRSLESVARHPDHGLLTAPEVPLREQDDRRFRIYSPKKIVAEFAPADKDHGALTDISLAPDGSLLVLERIFSGVFGVLAAVIHRVRINGDGTAEGIVVRFDGDKGHSIDSFEGLAHHENNHYFLVSDDNGYALQQTLLFYFSVE